jgi:phosphoenolpyruvate synthase/pyruvate phosphate dikinase
MKTEANKLLNDKIDSWSESLTVRLIEMRFIDIDEIKTVLKTHLKLGMIDLLKMQITDTERERQELISQLNKTKNIKQKIEISSQISKINIRLKSERMLYAELDRDRRAKEMTLWMREHHPESILSFYDMYDKKFQNNI